MRDRVRFKKPTNIQKCRLIEMLRAKVFDGYTGSDIEEEINKFFIQNPLLSRKNIHDLQIKMSPKRSTEPNHADETYIIAIMLYDDGKRKISNKVTKS